MGNSNSKSLSGNNFDENTINSKQILAILSKFDEIIPGSKEELLYLVGESEKRNATRRSYPTYLEIKKSIDQGGSIFGTSKRLHIPYSTCQSYLKMSPAELKKMKSLYESSLQESKKTPEHSKK
ncbi:MAG: hypothetical protein LBT62_03065 [Deltaproteobacteria bacterium]|jgi:hypothetical protein|nr:hypothetical protein [Deltaproteobacteria bacterium]